MNRPAPNGKLELAIIGCLLGTAVGDATGLVCEGMPRRRMLKLYPCLDGPRLIGHRGMVSDDTEHTCLVAQALVASAGDPIAFSRQLSHRLRFWLATLPAGVGWATLRATLKLSVGVPPTRSGVLSAGNGPAMRSALLGVCYGDQPDRLSALVRASTCLTHTDPRAEAGAMAVAIAAQISCMAGDSATLPKRYLLALECALDMDAAKGQTTVEFAASIGADKKVTGYVYQTVPVALHAWLRHPKDFRAAILEVIACGGDTDTTAAIVGAIVGAGVGRSGIPSGWLVALWEWPRTVSWMERLGTQLAEVCAGSTPQRALGLPLLPLLVRNVVFTSVVLAHGFRRLLPPY
jgi:ADP-ribosyl-[dinitrogen reductase] hydrolase